MGDKRAGEQGAMHHFALEVTVLAGFGSVGAWLGALVVLPDIFLFLFPDATSRSNIRLESLTLFQNSVSTFSFYHSLGIRDCSEEDNHLCYRGGKRVPGKHRGFSNMVDILYPFSWYKPAPL